MAALNNSFTAAIKSASNLYNGEALQKVWADNKK